MTPDDAISTESYKIVGAPLNGKRFFAYDSAVDRLHVWDPGLSSPRVRRAGLQGVSTAPTVANTGASTYAAVLRYYRVRFLQITNSRIVRRSEPSSSVSFTPSGAGTHARVTRPTAPGEQDPLGSRSLIRQQRVVPAGRTRHGRRGQQYRDRDCHDDL